MSNRMLVCFANINKCHGKVERPRCSIFSRCHYYSHRRILFSKTDEILFIFWIFMKYSCTTKPLNQQGKRSAGSFHQTFHINFLKGDNAMEARKFTPADALEKCAKDNYLHLFALIPSLPRGQNGKHRHGVLQKVGARKCIYTSSCV